MDENKTFFQTYNNLIHTKEKSFRIKKKKNLSENIKPDRNAKTLHPDCAEALQTPAAMQTET